MAHESSDFHSDSQIIDRIGTTSFVAAECEVSSQAVSKWRRTGIPRAPRKFLRLKFPQAFGVESGVAA